ncbi:ubiquitin-like-specific protease ESD4 [Coffea arabica]|uniref:Ubiquitin-like-specific protease ESD4 n=1 Tax=Coffea arabica TaxID=13443 RepID=A0ABM4X176_COFAR
MGALTSNRKRGYDFSSSVNYGSLVSNSPVSKKSRLPASINQTTGRTDRITAVFQFFRYPVEKTLFKREPHAPVRRHRGVSSVNLGNSASKVSYKVGSADEMGNLLSGQYKSTKRSALDTLRFNEEDKKVTEVAKEEVQEVSEDSSIEEVEILEVREDQKWKDGNGVVDEDSRKFDGIAVDKDSRPSSSSAMTNVSDGILKVETTEKLLASLSLSQELGVPQESVHKKLLYVAERRNDKINSLNFQIEYTEKQLQLQQLLRPQKKEEAAKKDVTAEAFKPLTEEEETEVNRALSNSSRRKLLVTHENSNISITGEVLQCLRPRAWLNDEVINLYLELLKERERREPKKFLNCHFFNTFFFKKLVSGKGGYNYQSVRRWTSQKKLGYCIFDCDKIFVPIHKEVHWCLAVINKKDEKFQYLDSLGGVDSQVIKVLARYIVDEVKDKCGKGIDVSSWQQEFVADLPEQENGFDCGVFMIKYADFYSRDIGLCFNQEHMPYFRLRTALEILRSKAE